MITKYDNEPRRDAEIVGAGPLSYKLGDPVPSKSSSVKGKVGTGSSMV